MNYVEGNGAFLSREELERIGFANLGQNVLVSRKASIYSPELISLADHVRVDDFCCLSGLITLGRNTHVTPYCLLAGGTEGILSGEFCTFAYRVSVFSQSDDYLGSSMVNSTISPRFKLEKKAQIFICDHVIVGASSVVMPGVCLAEGTSIGAFSLIIKSTEPWGVYYGIPAIRQKERSKNILKLANDYRIQTNLELNSANSN